MSVDRVLSFVAVRARIPARCLLLLSTLALFFCFFCGLSVPPPTAPPPPSTNIVTLSLTPSASHKFNSEKFLFLDGKW
jgi:hypothetical protein